MDERTRHSSKISKRNNFAKLQAEKKLLKSQIETLIAENERLKEREKEYKAQINSFTAALENERWRDWSELPENRQRIRVGFMWDDEGLMSVASFEEDCFYVKDLNLFRIFERRIYNHDERKVFNLEKMKEYYTHWRPAAQAPESKAGLSGDDGHEGGDTKNIL